MSFDADKSPAPELLVVGAAFFEAFVPAGISPEAGVEKYVDEIPLGLGGALNSATVAAAIGVRTAFMHPRTTWLVDGAIGECCHRTGISEIQWGGGGAPFVTLVWSDADDRAFVSSSDWTLFSGCPDFPFASHVHIGGLTEFNLLRTQSAAARARGSIISTCAGWDPPSLERLAAETACPLDVLFMNRAEAVHVCGSVEKALESLPGRAAVDVVVTDGPAGAIASVGGGLYCVSSPAVDVVDPTGAGDAFAAAYVAAMILAARSGRPFSPGEVLENACVVASKVVGILGGVVTDRDQVTSR